MAPFYSLTLAPFLALVTTQDRKARSGDFWVDYGQLTQTGSHAKDTIERRHKFFTEKMLALLNPQPEDS